MSLTQLEEQSDYFRYYVLPDSRVILIELEEDGTEIRISTASGELIGNFYFRALHEEDDFRTKEAYKLTGMGLEEASEDYKRMGIGTECMRLHKDLFPGPIFTGPRTGKPQSDGSHLVNDGPHFADAMIRLGYITAEVDDDFLDEEE